MNTTADYERVYGKWHSYEPAHVAVMRAHFERLAGDALPADRGARVLDVGCAMGFALLWLRDLGFAAEGVDRDEGLVRQCRARQLEASCTADTAAWLAERPGRYALVLAFDVIEHLPPEGQLALCRAIRAALAPGGRLVCTVPNANSALAARWRYQCWTHRASFTETSLDYLLFQAGFRDITVGGAEHVDPARSPQGRLRELLRAAFRAAHRLELAAELGWRAARGIPLTPNLRAVAAPQA